MAYEQDGGAEDQLDNAPAPGAGPDGGGGDSGEMAGKGKDTFFLPPDFHPGADCKPGDKITLEVVGKDKDGDYEVRVADGGSKGNWRDDMKKSLGTDLSGPKEQM